MLPASRYPRMPRLACHAGTPRETPEHACPLAGAEPMSENNHDKSHLQQLLRRASESDEQAWHELVERYAGRVFGLIRSMGAGPEMAEEITQSTFCKVAEKIETYSELGRFEAWLFRIASNRYRDEVRRRNRQATSVDHEALTGLAGAGADREAAAGHAYEPAELIALREAMAELSDNDREVIHLRHAVELSFQQIAEILEEPIGTVLARHHRAKRKLADKLGHLGPPGQE